MKSTDRLFWSKEPYTICFTIYIVQECVKIELVAPLPLFDTRVQK